MKEKPSYYAIIPAEVRYDRDLIPKAIILYGEITALSNTKGYCWASNTYFAKLYNVSTRAISRWIESLSDKGYITVKIKDNNTRHIFLPTTKMSNPYDKIVMGDRQKRLHNSKKNNKKNRTKEKRDIVDEGSVVDETPFTQGETA